MQHEYTIKIKLHMKWIWDRRFVTSGVLVLDWGGLPRLLLLSQPCWNFGSFVKLLWGNVRVWQKCFVCQCVYNFDWYSVWFSLCPPSFFRPWQCIFRPLLIRDIGGWKWQGTTINQTLKAKSDKLKDCHFWWIPTLLGFGINPDIPDSFECLHTWFFDWL